MDRRSMRIWLGSIAFLLPLTGGVAADVQHDAAQGERELQIFDVRAYLTSELRDFDPALPAAPGAPAFDPRAFDPRSSQLGGELGGGNGLARVPFGSNSPEEFEGFTADVLERALREHVFHADDGPKRAELQLTVKN